MYNDLTGYV